jgi:hypothetical protein
MLTLPGVGERRSRGGRPCVRVASSGSQLGMGDMAAYLVDVDSARGGREAQQRRAAYVRVASSGSQLGMGDMAAYLVEVDSARGGREAQQRRAALCPSSQLR